MLVTVAKNVSLGSESFFLKIIIIITGMILVDFAADNLSDLRNTNIIRILFHNLRLNATFFRQSIRKIIGEIKHLR